MPTDSSSVDQKPEQNQGLAPEADTKIETSAAQTTPVETQESVPDAQNTAESSTADAGAKKDDAPKSMLEAVQKALAPADDSAKAAAAVQKSEGESPTPEAKAGEADAGADEKREAEDKKLPFHNHPRFRELVKDRNTFKAEAERWKTELEAVKPQIERFEAFRGYVQKTGLSGEDLNTTFAIAAALRRGDVDGAHKLLEPVWNHLQTIRGAVLPADLQQKVESGTVDEATARELARKRGEAALAQSQVQRTVADVETSRREAEAAAVDKLAADCEATVNALEQSWQKNDPDYLKKQPFVLAELNALMATEGKNIRSPDDAKALAEKARKNVDDRLAVILPKTSQKREVTHIGGSSSAKATPRPSSLLDVVKQAAAGEYTPPS